MDLSEWGEQQRDSSDNAKTDWLTLPALLFFACCHHPKDLGLYMLAWMLGTECPHISAAIQTMLYRAKREVVGEGWSSHHVWVSLCKFFQWCQFQIHQSLFLYHAFSCSMIYLRRSKRRTLAHQGKQLSLKIHHFGKGRRNWLMLLVAEHLSLFVQLWLQ